MAWQDRFEQERAYEAEGAVAASQGKMREHCPYDDQASDAWNFWVYGNENEQGRMLDEFMRAEGTKPVYMSTGDLGPETEKAMREWEELAQDATRRMRKERGWD